MQLIPLMHTVFFLATLFSPKGTMKFTVSSVHDQKMTWFAKLTKHGKAQLKMEKMSAFGLETAL
jgi:hypothetical protein